LSLPLVVVWLGGAFSLAHHEPDLRSWSEARLVALEDASADAPLPAADHADTSAARVETLLGEARAALFGADGAAAEAALDAAESEIEGHAELPESAFLLAELWRTRAALLLEKQPEASLALLAAAEAIDGPVATPFGATAGPRPAAGTPPDHPTRPMHGPRPGDVVFVDGALAHEPRVAPGRHHVRVVRGSRMAWAGWVTVGEGGVDLPLLGPAPCTEGDLGRVRYEEGALALPTDVQCGNWVAVRSVARDRIEIARCRASTCGPFLPWSRAWGHAFALPAQPAWPRRKSSDWLFWAAASVLASTATGIVLWQAGAFEREGPGRERFEFVPPERP